MDYQTTISPTGTYVPDRNTPFEDLSADREVQRLLDESSAFFHSKEYAERLNKWQKGSDRARFEEINRLNSSLILAFKRKWKEADLNVPGELFQIIERDVRLIVTFVIYWQKPEFVNLGVTGEDSILFQIKYSDRNAYLELFWDEEEGSTELVFNMYKNKSPLPAYGGQVQKTLSKFLAGLNA